VRLRLLQTGNQALQVADLRQHALVLFDQRHLAATLLRLLVHLADRGVCECELALQAPQLELVQCLSQHRFALRL
jgi:hypothetical protein